MTPGWSWVRVLGVALVAGFIALLASPQRLDNAIADVLLAQRKHSAVGPVLLVEITPADVARTQETSAMRGEIARVLSHADAGGARRIYLDLGLPTMLRPADDAALAAAMVAVGRDRLVVASSADRPLAEPFTGIVRTADAEFLPDPDGWFRRVRVADNARNPVDWLVTGAFGAGLQPIDLRLDPATIDATTLGAALANPRPVELFRDRLVVIAYDRVAGRSAVSIAGHGQLGRGRMISLATQSALQDYAQQSRISAVAAIVFGVLALAMGVFIGRIFPTARRTLVALALASVMIAFGSIFILHHLGVWLQPMTTVALLSAGFMASIFVRLQVFELFSAFLKGDLSPEEAWAWRSQADRPVPVVLFGARGAVKHANPNAGALTGAKEWVGAADFSSACMPNLRDRSTLIRAGEDGDIRAWRVEWLHDSINLAAFYEVTDEQRTMADLERRLKIDPLTGALNRIGFERHLEQLSGSGDYTVLYLDMNGFKAVNDALGHAAGDELLRVVATRFEGVIRDGDRLARLGGDEFAIITAGRLSDTFSERLQRDLQDVLTHPIAFGTRSASVGVAVGYASPKSASERWQDVVARADAAMYANKSRAKKAAAA
ncbi:MAG: diguanylate cyclase [Alphaproteobacteria bacterium]